MYNSKNKNVDLEVDYAPSRHTTRFQDQPHPEEAVVEHFVQLTLEQTKELTTKHGISVHSNLRYGGTDDRRLVDVYYKSADMGTPLFVFVHSGYWQFLDKNSAGSLVAPLVASGYRVLVMDYNICPQVTLSELFEQFIGFLSWVFDYAQQTNTPEISFAGHSAGAHLLTSILNTPEVTTATHVALIRAIFLISGVYDLRELWHLHSVNPDDILNLNADGAKRLSPICWQYTNLDAFNGQGTEIHVLVAAHDSETFIGQSRGYAELLKRLGLNVQYKLFEQYDHMDILEEGAKEGTAITTYLRRVLKK